MSERPSYIIPLAGGCLAALLLLLWLVLRNGTDGRIAQLTGPVPMAAAASSHPGPVVAGMLPATAGAGISDARFNRPASRC